MLILRYDNSNLHEFRVINWNFLCRNLRQITDFFFIIYICNTFLRSIHYSISFSVGLTLYYMEMLINQIASTVMNDSLGLNFQHRNRVFISKCIEKQMWYCSIASPNKCIPVLNYISKFLGEICEVEKKWIWNSQRIRGKAQISNLAHTNHAFFSLMSIRHIKVIFLTRCLLYFFFNDFLTSNCKMMHYIDQSWCVNCFDKTIAFASCHHSGWFIRDEWQWKRHICRQGYRIELTVLVCGFFWV